MDKPIIDELLSKRLFIIVGSMGTGKTIFIRNIKQMMNGQESFRVYDDMQYMIDSKSARKKDLQVFTDKINVLRQTDERIIITMHDLSRLHTPVRNMLHQDFVLKNTAIILTSLAVEQLQTHHLLKWFKPKGDSLLRNFKDEYHYFVTRGKKVNNIRTQDILIQSPVLDQNRPFLLMTDNGHKIGQFGMVYENWPSDVEEIINPSWIDV